MKRPGHSRAPSMTAKQRRYLLEYAAWQEGSATENVSDAAFRFANAVVHSDYGFLCEYRHCGRIAASLAYDGTDGP